MCKGIEFEKKNFYVKVFSSSREKERAKKRKLYLSLYILSVLLL